MGVQVYKISYSFPWAYFVCSVSILLYFVSNKLLLIPNLLFVKIWA